jgi:hypothetical protein
VRPGETPLDRISELWSVRGIEPAIEREAGGKVAIVELLAERGAHRLPGTGHVRIVCPENDSFAVTNFFDERHDFVRHVGVTGLRRAEVSSMKRLQ